MTIKWIGAHPNNYTIERDGKTVNKIVMHWSVGTLESCDATFANPDRKASAHYGIGDSEIHQYVKEEDTAWHAGNWSVNQTSIGIEHEGGWLLDNGTRFKPTDETHQTSAELVADICRRYNLPIDRNTIHVHNEYRATQCPGTLDVDRIIEIAKNINATTEPARPEKIDLGDPWGEMEIQAIVSTLNDQKRDLTECKNSFNNKVKELEEAQKINCDNAINTAIKERNDYWQPKFESANNRIALLQEENIRLKDKSFKSLGFFIKLKLLFGRR